jgi:DNA repair protein SbcD/Mre11
MIRVLHFADAHIDIANHGRHDPRSGLAIRVLDFLKALDTIVDTAISEQVDMVLFCGDAYRDRTPVPTFQREWGKRILRLSQAGIPTLLLVGNHDLSPASGRAHALQEFDTLQVPHVKVIDKPCFLGPDDLLGLPLQIIGLPWVSRAGIIGALELNTAPTEHIDKVNEELESKITGLIQHWLEKADETIPIIFASHGTVQGAKFGNERSVMLGSDLILPGALVRDPRLAYTALGHIHKAQDLNESSQPPVVYPGSIERIDFGEVNEKKKFVIADVEHGCTRVSWRDLEGRPFIDRFIRVDTMEAMQTIFSKMPSPEELKEAIVRVIVEYPRDLEPLLDEPGLRKYGESAFEFHFLRKPQIEARARLQMDGKTISSLTPLELLDKYWKSTNTEIEDLGEITKLAEELLRSEGSE